MDADADDMPLPNGIVREAAAPQRLAIIWASHDVSSLHTNLGEIGVLAVQLAPDDTEDFVSTSGEPSLLVVESDLLDHRVLAAVETLRARYGSLTIWVLAGQSSHATGLLSAMRAGLTNVLESAEPECIARLLGLPRERGLHERVLAVGAHPDDVEIGCGATLLRHTMLGDPVTILTLSRGAVGGPQEVRRREAIGAAMAMSAELLMGDLADTRMGEAPEMVSLVEGVIAAVRPTTVYVHSAADSHQDHRAVHDATLIAARRVPQVFCYQSPSSRNDFAPNKFVPVDDTINDKVLVISHYKTQNTRHYLDPELIVATGRYWARQLPNARYAEPFEVIRATEGSSVSRY